MRAFALGITLIAILFGGFVMGIELGTPPGPGAARTEVITENGSERVVTTMQPVVTTVIKDGSRIEYLPGSDRVVIVRENGERVVGYLRPPSRDGGSNAGGESREPPDTATREAGPGPVTVYVEQPTTVTTPAETVTDTITVTITETQPPPSDPGTTGDGSGDQTPAP